MVIVTGEYGQLGNRLIVLANLIAAAREHGLAIADPAFARYAPDFESTRFDPLARYPAPAAPSWVSNATARRIHAATTRSVRWLRRVERRIGGIPRLRVLDIGWFGECDLDSGAFLDLARRPGVLLLKGWQFRARASFERHADAIRTFLQPLGAYRAQARAAVERLRRDADIVIGVHVRHGDYRTFQDGRFFFDIERYAAWMRSLRDRHPGRRVGFLVTSNAPQPMAAFDGLRVDFAPGNAVVDLHALAACDAIVGPPSTFSQWASFAGQAPLCTLLSDNDEVRLERFSVTTHFDERRRAEPARAALRPVA